MVDGIRGLTTIVSMTYSSAGLPPMGKRLSFQAIICHQLLSGRFLVLRNVASTRRRLGSGVSERRIPLGKAANELVRVELSLFPFLNSFGDGFQMSRQGLNAVLVLCAHGVKCRTTICERFTLGQ